MRSAGCTTSAALLLISAALLLLSTASAFNITRILDQYPDFNNFNNLLSTTNLAGEINRRRTITVLALSNGCMGELNSKPADAQKRILSTHVILDYFDIDKLNKLKDTKTVLTTLYQSTGTADDQQGFLNVVHNTDGSIYFGSAVRGSRIDAKLESSVAKQPYNISVLSISHVIIAPGIDGSTPFPDPVAAAPVPSASRKAPPPPPPAAPAESPAEEPADAPAPASGSAPAPAPGDSDDELGDVDDLLSPPTEKSAGERMAFGASLALMMAFASFLAAQ